MIIYPIILQKSYIWKNEDREKTKSKILKIIKRKKLPKELEISLIRSLLSDLEETIEHEYSKKYNTF